MGKIKGGIGPVGGVSDLCGSCRWSAWSFGGPGLACVANTQFRPPRRVCQCYEYEPGTDAIERQQAASCDGLTT